MSDSNTLINDILKQVDVVNVISSYINVLQKGRNYVALCPFHDDKNPSMMISREKQIFKCFVCGAGGNAISFIEKYEKIPFMQAMKKAADISGIYDSRLLAPIKTSTVSEETSSIYSCLEDLAAYYEYALTTEEGELAKAYLGQRGIDESRMAFYRLGYALKDGAGTINFLQQKGHSLKTIEKAGIALMRASGTSDANAGRLIFPLCDSEGRVVGFSARKFNDADDGPKYVNSPESSLFHKSELLYNLHNAKLSAKNDNYLYVVEGFLDVIALHKINIKSTVAIMGTAFTKEHAQLLRPLNCEVRLCLDSDNAGQMAMMRAMPILDKEKISYRLVLTPNNKLDPDEILKEKGEEALRLHLNTLVDPFDFALNYYEMVQPLGSTSDRHKVIKHFLPMLLKLNKGLELDNRLFKLAKVTRFEPKALVKFIEEARTKEVDEQTLIMSLPEMQFKTYRQDLRRLQNAEKTMLYYMFQDRDSVTFYEEEVKFFYFEIYRHIALYIIDFLNNNETLDVSQLINDISLKDVANKEEVINEISSFAVKFTVPPVNEEILNDLKQTMIEEKTILHEKETLEKSLIGKSETEKARIIDDYNRSLRKRKK